jgi:hypothetical protein
MTRRDFAIAFLLTMVIGLLVVMWREHAPQQQLPLVEASAPVACVPPMSHWQFKQRRIA